MVLSLRAENGCHSGLSFLPGGPNQVYLKRPVASGERLAQAAGFLQYRHLRSGLFCQPLVFPDAQENRFRFPREVIVMCLSP